MDHIIVMLQNFLLVSLRAGCLLYFCPPWDSRFIPAQIRLFSILGLSLALTPLVAPYLPPFPGTWSAGVYLVIREVLIGLGCGLAFRFMFAGIRMAGDLVAIQMGFGMASLVDPDTQAQNTILAEMLVLLATLVFLALDGHQALLRLLAQSFQEVPLNTNVTLPVILASLVPELGRLMYSLAVQALAPVFALLFLTQLALGLVARAVPQIQVMIVGFPLTIALGLFFLSLTLAASGQVLVDQFAHLKVTLTQILLAWKD
jgi:flagellar biosynthetic protein FliR|uniref:Flagellar biosynthetic protein FliR n=1 Tax=Desulfobacca acetoxidans TaxID=60893 RepID=A0A7C3YY06_9BACT